MLPPHTHTRTICHYGRDLNADPSGWALADASVDAVVCCVRWASDAVLLRCNERRRSALAHMNVGKGSAAAAGGRGAGGRIYTRRRVLRQVSGVAAAAALCPKPPNRVGTA